MAVFGSYECWVPSSSTVTAVSNPSTEISYGKVVRLAVRTPTHRGPSCSIEKAQKFPISPQHPKHFLKRYHMRNFYIVLFAHLCLLLQVFLFLGLVNGTLASEPDYGHSLRFYHKTLEMNSENNMLKEISGDRSDSSHLNKMDDSGEMSVMSKPRIRDLLGLYDKRDGKSEDTKASQEIDKKEYQLVIRFTSSDAVHDFCSIMEPNLIQVLPPMAIHIYTNLDSFAKKFRLLSESMKQQVSWIGYYGSDLKSSLNFSKLDNVVTPRSSTTSRKTVSLKVLTSGARKTESIVQEIENEFKARDCSQCSVTSISKQSVKVSVTLTNADSALAILKNIEDVVWIERVLSYKAANYEAGQIVQSDILNHPSALGHSIWDRGLTGKGEIVGVADSGIDHDHCMFQDSNQEVVADQYLPNHRKIIYYQTQNVGGQISDDKDSVSGHGTHVAATLAGSIESTLNVDPILRNFTGVAKDARLFFTDTSYDEFSWIVPDNLEDLFRPAYEHGARIHSNSWGCDLPDMTCTYPCECRWTVSSELGKEGDLVSEEVCQQWFGVPRCCEGCSFYDSQAQQADKFTFEHDDLLVIVANGNSGDSAAVSTVGSPAVSKNALSVGASVTTNKALSSSVDYFDISTRMNGLEAVGVTDIDSCCAFVGQTDEDTKSVRDSCCPTNIKEGFSNERLYRESNVVSWSSRGPTLDGRTKPDLVAPGFYITSAHSDGDIHTNQCSNIRPEGNNTAALLAFAGTSMATPVVAGAAALVRQYYREEKAMSNPSGYLLKATLIHSSQFMNGIVQVDGDLIIKDLPTKLNIYNGYGLVSLTTALQFSDSDFTLFALDRQTVLHKATMRYCFEATDQTDVRATLSWYDPPGPVGLKNVLVNNLNLVVQSTSLHGVFRGNDHSTGDKLNNNERVDVRRVSAGSLIAIDVHGSRILTSSQKFALTVTGRLQAVSEDQCSSLLVSHASRFKPAFALFVVWLVYVLAL